MKKTYHAFCLLALVSTAAGAEDVIFKLDLTALPIAQHVNIQPDYSSGKQTMYLKDATVGYQQDQKTRMLVLAGGGTSYTDFFVSKPTYLSKDVLTVTWSGRRLATNGGTFLALGGGHFENIATVRAKSGKLFLETEAGSKLFGTYTNGATYEATISVDYSQGAASPTVRLKYLEHLSPTQSHIYGPIVVKVNTKFNALASNYFTVLTYGENSVEALYALKIATGMPPLKLPDYKQLPPQKLPLMTVPKGIIATMIGQRAASPKP